MYVARLKSCPDTCYFFGTEGVSGLGLVELPEFGVAVEGVEEGLVPVVELLSGAAPMLPLLD